MTYSNYFLKNVSKNPGVPSTQACNDSFLSHVHVYCTVAWIIKMVIREWLVQSMFLFRSHMQTSVSSEVFPLIMPNFTFGTGFSLPDSIMSAKSNVLPQVILECFQVTTLLVICSNN